MSSIDHEVRTYNTVNADDTTNKDISMTLTVKQRFVHLVRKAEELACAPNPLHEGTKARAEQDYFSVVTMFLHGPCSRTCAGRVVSPACVVHLECHEAQDKLV